MSWTFNTWKTWTDLKGRTWVIRIVAGAAAGAASTLLWYERPRQQPDYPTARDEAELIAATAERKMAIISLLGALSSSTLFTSQFASTNGPVTATNTVGFYPSRATLTACAGSIGASANPIGRTATWVRMQPEESWTSDLSIFADDGVSWAHMTSNTVDGVWWTNHIGRSTGFVWSFPFQTNAHPRYVSTAPYSQIAKAASAMRATFTPGIIGECTNYTRTGTGTDPVWSVAWAEALADMEADTTIDVAVSAGNAYESFWAFNEQVLDDYVIVMTETVSDIGFGYYFGAILDDPAEVLLTIQVAGLQDGFRMEGVSVATTNRPLMLWRGTLDDMGTRLTGVASPSYVWRRPAADWWYDIPAPPTPQQYNEGWIARSSDIKWTVRHGFQHLTNTAAFWP
jgi:hypothetical protein